MSEFKKDDQGKPRPDLIPPDFLMAMGRVMAHGAKIYGEHNWRECKDPERYSAAMYRHLLEYLQGLGEDSDTGESPLVHLACSAAIRWALEEREKDEDNLKWVQNLIAKARADGPVRCACMLYPIITEGQQIHYNAITHTKTECWGERKND